MSFLDINGLAIDVAYDELDRANTDAQTFGRSEGLTFEGALWAEKREWNFTVPWEVLGAHTNAIVGWVKGRGHYYTFERLDGATTRFQRYSTDGGPGFDSSLSNCATTRFGTWAGRVGSAGSSTVTVTFGSEGRWTVSGWRSVPVTNATYSLFSFVYDGTTTRLFDGATVAASHAFALCTPASGYLSVTLAGTNSAGSSATTQFDGLMIVPYAMSTPQLTARNARTAAEPGFPYVEMDGDCLEDLNPIVVKGFVPSEGMTQVNRNGTQNARSLKISLIQR